jgi:hypothetical protein
VRGDSGLLLPDLPPSTSPVSERESLVVRIGESFLMTFGFNVDSSRNNRPSSPQNCVDGA